MMDEVNKTTKLAEPGVEHENIELFYSENGEVRVKVTAPTVTIFGGANYTEFNDGLKS
ncbi:MAG: hypothetical protein IPL12_21360 [Bacteroidetes bacterium]|nr:hypothetical protein [Bacteroidota bacterium]